MKLVLILAIVSGAVLAQNGRHLANGQKNSLANALKGLRGEWIGVGVDCNQSPECEAFAKEFQESIQAAGGKVQWISFPGSTK